MQRRRLARRWIVLGMAALGCSGSGDDDRSLREGLARLPQDTSAEPVPAESLPVADRGEEGLPDTLGLPDIAPSPAPVTRDTVPPLRPGEPRDVRPWVPETPTQLGAPQDEWIAGIRQVRRTVTGVATLTSVRAARNEGFDRVVFQFAGSELPGYHIEYVDRPVRQCGSGEPVRIEGDAWLRVRMEPSQAHDDDGRATVRERRQRLDLPVLRELRLTCDFEAQVEWVLGVGTPNRYRVLELREPARLVVDVRH